MENFIYKFQIKDTSLCDRLIEYHKNDKEYKSTGEVGSANIIGGGGVNKNAKDSIDVNIHNSSTNPHLRNYFRELNVGLLGYINKYKLFNHRVHTEYVNLISEFPPGGGYKVFHNERTQFRTAKRCFVFMTYLNTIKKGGETEFLYQKLKVKPKKGLTLIWPTDFTHTHRGLPANETKYIITGWYSFTP